MHSNRLSFKDPTLLETQGAPFFTIRLVDVEQFPDWYVRAFEATGYTAHMITDDQRLLPGVFRMKNGHELRAAIFGRVENGRNSSQTLNKPSSYFIFVSRVGNPVRHLHVEMQVVGHIHRHLAKNSIAVTMSKTLAAYNRIVKTFRSRYEGIEVNAS